MNTFRLFGCENFIDVKYLKFDQHKINLKTDFER